jgi:hypothetical protein
VHRNKPRDLLVAPADHNFLPGFQLSDHAGKICLGGVNGKLGRENELANRLGLLKQASKCQADYRFSINLLVPPMYPR